MGGNVHHRGEDNVLHTGDSVLHMGDSVLHTADSVSVDESVLPYIRESHLRLKQYNELKVFCDLQKK
uniref:Uncharacterized protein n=1 Tax=Parascaris univalens TaxID=6257 RepID=A0A914ZQD1_PARUN